VQFTPLRNLCCYSGLRRPAPRQTFSQRQTCGGSGPKREGTPADPPTLHTAVPNWQFADTIPLGADRMLRVIETRFEDDDPVLVVEPA
jgi:hypothetical protein